jgi:distribution and morphology protein 10
MERRQSLRQFDQVFQWYVFVTSPVALPKLCETAILDFNVPRGLHLSISKSPNALFSTSYSMNAMPSLNGSVGYIFTSCELNIKSSGDVRFKDMMERFKVHHQPRRPEGKGEEWLAGERVDTRG